jgi:hypothetical protein
MARSNELPLGKLALATLSVTCVASVVLGALGGLLSPAAQFAGASVAAYFLHAACARRPVPVPVRADRR